MIFNFDEKSLERCSWEHKVFHLPPDNDFALHFFDGFLSKFDLQELLHFLPFHNLPHENSE